MPGDDRWCVSERVRTRWSRKCRWMPQRTLCLTVRRGCIAVECWYMHRRGLYPSRLRRLDQPSSPWVVFRMVCEAMRKRTSTPAPAPGDGPKHLAPLMTKGMASFPNLVMHCAVTRYDDGDPRQPGWFTVRTQGSAWVIILKDPDSATQMQCLGNTLDDAMALAELMVGADDAPWELDQWAKRQGQRKGK